MANCEDDNGTGGIEVASLPLLSGCPADHEFFLVGNAIGGQGTYKYARRRWADLKNCLGGIYPFIITSADFQPDGISYNNPNIVGDNLSLFVNEYSQQWLVQGSTTFSYTGTGIIMNIPGFDSNTQSWTIMVQRLNS